MWNVECWLDVVAVLYMSREHALPSERAFPLGRHYNSRSRHLNRQLPRRPSIKPKMFSPSLLWIPPEINPINNKARSIPVLNPLCVHGRVFLFSWLGFFIAFWSW